MNRVQVNFHTDNEITIQIPHRISGFFQMMDPHIDRKSLDPAQIGSRGGGPALSAFGTTRIYLEDRIQNSKRLDYKIWINSKEVTPSAVTSKRTLELMAEYLPHNYSYHIHHKFDLPMGAGYGSSGAGALGIAFGLQKLLQLPFSDEEVAYFAHAAEVESHTGLGTVSGQYTGGLSITLEPGCPFKMQVIPVASSIKIVTGSFGSLSTKKILTNHEYQKLIYQTGKMSMQMMRKDFSVKNYLAVCQFFLDTTQIIKKLKLHQVDQLLQQLSRAPILGAGMNQLGRSVFAFTHIQHVKEVEKIFSASEGIKFVKILEVFPPYHEIKKN